MKIIAGYYYLLDGEKPIKIIWTKHEKSCVLKLGTEYPTAIVDNDRISGLPINGEELIKLGFELIYQGKFRNVYDFSKDLRFGYSDNYGLANMKSQITFVGNCFDHMTEVHQLQIFYYSITNKELEYEK